jgi:CDP-diglyceride synthetase
MLRTRILVSLLSLPVLIGVILAGGALYFVAAVGILGVGAWELYRLMRGGGYAPSLLVSWLVLGRDSAGRGAAGRAGAGPDPGPAAQHGDHPARLS